MSRAAQQQRQQDQSALNTNQTVLNQQTAKINAAGDAIPGDLTPEQKAAQTAQTTGGVATAYGQGRQRALDTAARTGSRAGFGEINSNLTHGQARDASSATQQLQQYFANVPLQRAQEKASIYSMAANPTEANLNSNTSQVNGLNQLAYGPGLFSNLLTSAAGAAGGAVAGKYTHP